jgi:hypothetical protein
VCQVGGAANFQKLIIKILFINKNLLNYVVGVILASLQL